MIIGTHYSLYKARIQYKNKIYYRQQVLCTLLCVVKQTGCFVCDPYPEYIVEKILAYDGTLRMRGYDRSGSGCSDVFLYYEHLVILKNNYYIKCFGRIFIVPKMINYMYDYPYYKM